MHPLSFDYRNVMISMAWSAECNPTDSGIYGAVAEDIDRNVVKKGVRVLLLDGRHRCGAMRQLKAEGGHWRSKIPLYVTHLIRRNGQAIEQARAIKLSRTTDTSTVIVRMIRSFPSMVKVVLRYAGAFEL